MDSPNPHSMQALIGLPNSTKTTLSPLSSATLSPPIPPPPQPSPPPPPSPQNGVVVVGFIGRRSGDVTQLINRVLDANVFGSGNRGNSFYIQKVDIDEDVKNWFNCRRISYFHDSEKGIMYLQFSSTGCPAMEDFLESSSSSSFQF